MSDAENIMLHIHLDQLVFGAGISCYIRINLCLALKYHVTFGSTCVWHWNIMLHLVQLVFGTEISCYIRFNLCLALKYHVTFGSTCVWH